MILRSTIIGSGVALVALLSTNCNAFTPQHYHRTSITTTTQSKLYQGFKEYPNEFDHPDKPTQSSIGGGPSPELLKKMGVSDGQLPTSPSTQQSPPVAATQQPSQQFYDANGNPITTPPMVYDANGNLVPFTAPPQPIQQMQSPSQAQQQPAQTMQAQQGTGQAQIQFEPNVPNALEPPLPAKSKNTDSPRPVGYNSDAYTMSNTADVYFAQLKQDSKVRKMARLSGDLETANKVFDDESVKSISENWNQNPYTKEKNLEEARREIEGTVRLQIEDQPNNGAPQSKSTGQISYKDKLNMAKAKRSSANSAGAVVTPPPPPVVKVVDQPKPVLEQQPKPVVNKVVEQPKIDQPKVVKPPTTTSSAPPQKFYDANGNPVNTTPMVRDAQGNLVPFNPSSPPKQQQQQSPPKEKKEVSSPTQKIEPPKAAVASPPKKKAEQAAPLSPQTAAISTSISKSQDEDEHRGTLRTLQGLLLKQRGGPGFGAGRLKAPEAKRLEDTVEEVKSILRKEAGMVEEKESSSPVVDAVVESPLVADVPPVVEKVSPPPQPNAAPAVVDPLAGSVACVEAALKMYKESAPEDRAAMLIPLREAMMAAATTTNAVITEREGSDDSTLSTPKAEAPVESRTKPDDVPMMGFPSDYAVTKPDAEEVSAPPDVSRSPAGNIEELALAASQMDATKVSSLLESGLEMTEEITDTAFWAVVNAVDRAEALDKPLSGDVPRMLHHIFDADHRHLLTREQIRTNVTCMMPEQEGANRIGMNSIFDDAAHKDLPLEEGRRCAGGDCSCACSRNIFPTFASSSEIDFDTFPGINQLTFNELETVSAATIIQFTRLIERVRRTIAHEYGVPLKTILPLQAYSRKYVAGTTQQGGGGGEGDFVILHTDEATHDGYHYSVVLYLSTKGEDFEGGDFVFNDPDPEAIAAAKAKLASGEDDDSDWELSREELQQKMRRAGRKFTHFEPTRGSAVIFSSGWENMHEVEKITSGTRYCVPAFFTTCPVPEQAYTQMVQGKPKTDEDIADDWLHLLLAHQQEDAQVALGRVKELLMKWHYMCTPLSEH